VSRLLRRATRTPDRTGLPVIGFVGIHSNGRPDMPVSQNETLAMLFGASGYRIRRTSAVRRPSLRTAHQILSILSWRSVDVMVVAVFSGPSFWIADFSSFLGKLTGKRVVLFLHGGKLPEFGPAHRRRVERTLQRADLVLAPSDFLASSFHAWGLDVRVVPNVLSLDRYDHRHRTSAEPRLLWMRTFFEHYDPLMAVRVLARVAAEVPDVRMTMAGADQGLLAATKAEAERLGVLDRIEFPGYIGAEEKRRAMAEHDIFLNTNVVDNTPVSVLEAAASGLVPVATAVGGVPKLLTDDVDSILVDSGDDEAMAAAVLRLLADPDLVSRLSAGARRVAEASGWEAVRRRWEAQLALLLPRSGS